MVDSLAAFYERSKETEVTFGKRHLFNKGTREYMAFEKGFDFDAGENNNNFLVASS